MTDRDTSAEAVEALKSRIMTMQTLGGYWVTAEDYLKLEAERDALAALDLGKVQALVEALLHLRGAYDCADVVDAALASLKGEKR